MGRIFNESARAAGLVQGSRNARWITCGEPPETVLKLNFFKSFNITLLSGSTSAISSLRPALCANMIRWRIRIVPMP